MAAPGVFGYPQRSWENFTGGDVLIAATGEREVRDRLQLQHPTAVQNGEASECAERLLLLELGVKSSEDLLSACDNNHRILKRRLEAVGLRRGGSLDDCATRLLMLLQSAVTELAPEHLLENEDDCDDLPPLIPLEIASVHDATRG